MTILSKEIQGTTSRIKSLNEEKNKGIGVGPDPLQGVFGFANAVQRSADLRKAQVDAAREVHQKQIELQLKKQTEILDKQLKEQKARKGAGIVIKKIGKK